MAEYPAREKFYANKFIRLLTKSCAAQEIGSDACWMLTVIAMQEDVKRYSGPVTYYNGQLMPLCAFESEGRLIRARQRAVDSGWLHYEQGAKRKPGRYWTHVPETSIDLPDLPMDESDSHQIRLQIESVNGSESDIPSQIASANGNTNEGNPKGIRSANGCPPILSPIPIPNTHTLAKAHKRLLEADMIPKDWTGDSGRKAIEDWCRFHFLDKGREITDIQLRNQLQECHGWSADKLAKSVELTIARGVTNRIYDADKKLPERTNGKPAKDYSIPQLSEADLKDVESRQ